MLHVMHNIFISVFGGCFLGGFLSCSVVKAEIPNVIVGNISHVLRNEAKEANKWGS